MFRVSCVTLKLKDRVLTTNLESIMREREREIRINLSDRQHSDQSVENSNTSNIKERAR